MLNQRLGLVLLGGVVMSSAAMAQSVVRVTPSVSTSMTYTDNVGASTNANSDFIFEVSPAIQISRQSGRVKGSMNASLRNVMYMDEDDRNSSFVTFSGRGEVEAVEDLLFVEARGVISRNNLSLFTGRSSTDTLNTDASDESRNFAIAPRLQFRFGSAGDGALRYQSQWQSGTGSTSGQRVDTWSANVQDGRAFGRLGWFVNYDQTDSHYDDGVRDVSRDIGRVGLSYALTPQFSLRGSVGHESNDYSSGSRQSNSTHGVGFDWTPTNRTSLSFFNEKRQFGRGYNVNFKHRARRSAWQLSYVRDFTSTDDVFTGSAEDYYFNLFSEALSNSITDPTQRDAVVRQLLSQLGVAGSGAQVGFVSNAQSLSRRLNGSMSLTGVRNTLTFSAFRSERSRLAPDLIASGLDQFANFDTVREVGASVSLNHRLSGLSTLSVALSRNKATGEGVASEETRRTGLSVGLSRSLGPKSSGSLSYRHQRADGTTDYTENTLTATLGVRF
ncbi:MAG: TIGR03016 family PEP-CTERM system-associated outer membrane protein [Rhodocyclaceae bacterium]|nr:TIGR03016 family PEP-CTERM system-associated outer membrane protein [Rhodocyclaceae bacterium]